MVIHTLQKQGLHGIEGDRGRCDAGRTGLGGATAIFSVVYGVLISPYPYADPDEIWAFGVSAPAGPQRLRPFRYDAFEEMARLPALADVMAYTR